MIATAPGRGGEKGETWVVQAKFYREQRVSVDVLRQTLVFLTSSAISHGLIVTNSGLTSVAREVLSDWKEKSGPELRVIDGPELTSLLLRHPELVHRYFSGSGGNE
jgi:restriction endonuclease Mrr